MLNRGSVKQENSDSEGERQFQEFVDVGLWVEFMDDLNRRNQQCEMESG